MNKRKILIFLFSFLFVGTVGLFVSINSSHNIKDNDTVEIVCTVESTNITINDDYATVSIFVSEYDGFLYILSSVCKNINLGDIRSIQPGDIIIGQIESDMIGQLNEKKGFCSILALKTEHKEIFSLSDYNQFLANESYPTKTAAIIVALIFLIADIYNIVLLKKENQSGKIPQ